ncbi:hypothetical protein SSX86_032343 [Deinandra increscens subsp. villosa]|uniref:Retrovirus-related Pol polyprotein from transposon TNT 1-94 n=1 Tax=Deinandra increscens subsp. villosa TaxID=3103831 RepID=A0AAP0GGW4_9ASTR
MVCTRPDLAYAVGIVSRYLSNPGKAHWEVVKWILRYLNGTAGYGLKFGKCTLSEHVITGYVDADFAKDRDKGRSVTGYLFQLCGNTVSWRSSLQKIVALSSTEAEYIALTEAIKEAIWLKGFITELGIEDCSAIVKCDNQGALQLSKNQMYHERTKHINVKYHFIREVISSGEITVGDINTKDNVADILTKAVGGAGFQKCLDGMGIG